MLAKRFSLLFYIRKPKNYVKGNQPIYMRITIDSSRLELSTQRECEPERWNSQSGRANGTKESIRNLNIYLDSLQAKVYEAHRSLLDKSDPVTVENLRRKLRGTVERLRMILEVFRLHNNQMQKLINSDEYAKGTWVHFTTAYMHLRDFIKWKFQQNDYPINQVDFAFISDFEFYLKSSIVHTTQR